MSTVADAVRLYLYRPGRKPGRTSYEAARKMEKAWGARKIDDLTQDDVDAWVMATHSRAKAETIRRDLGTFQAVIYMAAKRKWCERWKIDRPAPGDARTRCLEVDEIDRFIANTPDWAKPLFVFLFNTGARLGEALKLEWASVASDDSSVTLTTRKGKTSKVRHRRIPLNARARAAIAEMATRTGRTGRVFRGPSGANINSRFRVCTIVRNSICRKARIADFTAHDCRHTFASHLVRKGVHLRTVADLLGHSSIDMVMRYTHLAPTQHQAAVDLL